jgi:glycosyltransferase involved in cell wall biosynthesis
MMTLTELDEPEVDISIVINIHKGRQFLARAMLSFEEAANLARLSGLRTEVLFVLDRSDSATIAWTRAYRSQIFAKIHIAEVDNGSLGLSRDHGLRLARGEYVLFGDEDDLISFNTIVECHRVAVAEGPRCIVIPQYLFGFGIKHVLAAYYGSSQVSPLAFFSFHPYLSRLFVHSSIKHSVRFVDVRLSSGYAYEDWHFNATAYSFGFEFKIAPDTILFYRHRRSLLQSMDALSARQIPPSPLFVPTTYLRVCSGAGISVNSTHADALDLENIRKAFFKGRAMRELVDAARYIDPAIDMRDIENAPVMSNLIGDFRPGAAYLRACEIVGASVFTDVILVKENVAEEDFAYVKNLFNAIAARDSNFRLLVIDPSSTDGQTSRWDSIFGVVIVKLATLYPGLDAESLDIVALRLIEHTAPSARLFLLPGQFSHRFFAKYGILLTKNKKCYIEFDKIGAPNTDMDRSFYESANFQFVSEYLDELDTVLSCNETIGSYYRFRLDRLAEKWKVLRRGRSSINSASASSGLHFKSHILFWLSGELRQRTDLLLALAHRLQNSDPRIGIDVLDSTSAEVEHKDELLCENVGHAGPVDWKLGTEATKYDAIVAPAEDKIYPATVSAVSLFAIPRILVRRSVVNIATSKEVETGLIVETPLEVGSAADHLAEAVLNLYSNPELFSKMQRSALVESTERHGLDTFSKTVGKIFFND